MVRPTKHGRIIPAETHSCPQQCCLTPCQTRLISTSFSLGAESNSLPSTQEASLTVLTSKNHGSWLKTLNSTINTGFPLVKTGDNGLFIQHKIPFPYRCWRRAT